MPKERFMKADQPDGPRKHRCGDCEFCQMCSEARCNVCRGASKGKKPLSVQEQIGLFEKVNRDDPGRPDQPLSILDFPRKAG
ncbi:MAG: hypothetical protein V1816_07345 [Pseudomonadota bacterium]